MNVQFVYTLQINIRVLYQIILNDFHTVEFHTAIECRTVKSKWIVSNKNVIEY